MVLLRHLKKEQEITVFSFSQIVPDYLAVFFVSIFSIACILEPSLISLDITDIRYFFIMLVLFQSALKK